MNWDASFTCPRCGMTSYHPMDVAEGYCGACHDWTGPRGAERRSKDRHPSGKKPP